jgi:hypothetical protein
MTGFELRASNKDILVQKDDDVMKGIEPRTLRNRKKSCLAWLN